VTSVGHAAPGTPADALFIAGPSRSGTTLMARLFELHPEVFAFTELHFFEGLAAPSEVTRPLTRAEAVDLLARLVANQRAFADVTGVDARRFQATAADLLDGFGLAETTPLSVFRAYLQHETADHGKRIPCEQTPRNVFFIEDILRHVPNARVVVMTRDPRDVLASQKHKWRAPFLDGKLPRREALRLRANYHPLTTSLLWRASVRAGDSVGDPRVVHVRFEDLVARPEQEVERICAAVGLPFAPGMLEVTFAGSSFGRGEGRKGMNASALGRWQRGALTSTEAAICERVCAAEMRRHGYEPSRSGVAAPELALHAGSLPLKTAAAVALNARRYGDLRGAIRRRLVGRQRG
jgi:hypothetical protein